MTKPRLIEHVSEVYRRIYVGYIFKRARGRYRAFMHDGTSLGETAQGVAVERVRDAWENMTPIARYKEARRRAIESMKKRALEKGGESMGDRIARTVIKNCLLEQDAITELLFFFWELQRSRGASGGLKFWPPEQPTEDPDEIRRRSATAARSEERQAFAEFIVSAAPDLAAMLHQRLLKAGREHDPRVLALEAEIEKT